jgi:hypothetical protein
MLDYWLIDVNSPTNKMRKDSIGYRHNEHSVGLATIHLVWIPKRRKPVLKGDTALPAAIRYILKAESDDRRGARRKIYRIRAGSAVLN